MGTRRIKFNADIFIALFLSFSWEVGEEIPSHYVILARNNSRTVDIWAASREVEKLAYIFQFNDSHAERNEKEKHFVIAHGPVSSANNLISIFVCVLL